MVKLSSVTCALLAGSAAAFAPSSSVVSNSRSAAIDPLYENFGFSFAEDQAENTPDVILGEANYKQWVGEIQDNSFLNRQVRHTATATLHQLNHTTIIVASSHQFIHSF